MQTRSGLYYLRHEHAAPLPEKRFYGLLAGACNGKRARAGRTAEQAVDFFDGLPDDLVVLILSKLSACANAPTDFISALLTCRRFNELGMQSMVLLKLSAKGMGFGARTWSDSAHRFLKRCAEAGSLEACYTLGMIRFYCLGNRGSGASLMAKAAMGSHPEALYSLAVVQFNGSGGSKSDKDLRAGVALCARAAYYGHVDALRELGHCLQDGYGVRQNVAEGRRLLVQANARELAAVLSASSRISAKDAAAAASLVNLQAGNERAGFSACSLLSDFGCSVPAPVSHPANRFMVEWFSERGWAKAGVKGRDGLRMCSYGSCGRPETRRHEFRRCSVCGAVNYCSRACQALHWKLAHKAECSPMDRWLDEAAAAGEVAPAPVEDRGGQVNVLE